ncbi:hypothetical protein IE81DRAFT_326827 [Ceraceosorus guamensis]|uniref:Mtf2-like C-terminal domain-containing protein n=1 Tax=Ceraceosorus guamensis TaxID=1522189 RepID=A0A316VNJ0_9BASI|nr:hypothetical protein IE81DRAFT_326827 [Ceraceosorus guamensis]PWN39137.1 hypothetical protein IE81DRAFT_326827 [Ceraceosorus guamensis]
MAASRAWDGALGVVLRYAPPPPPPPTCATLSRGAVRISSSSCAIPTRRSINRGAACASRRMGFEGQRCLHWCAVRRADDEGGQRSAGRDVKGADERDEAGQEQAQTQAQTQAQAQARLVEDDAPFIDDDAGEGGAYTAAQLFPRTPHHEPAELRDHGWNDGLRHGDAPAEEQRSSGSGDHLPLINRFADEGEGFGNERQRRAEAQGRGALFSPSSSSASRSQSQAAHRTPLADWERQRFAELLRPLHSRLSNPNESAFGSSVAHGWERFARRNRLGGYSGSGGGGRFVDEEDGAGTSVELDWAGRGLGGRGRRRVPIRTIGAQMEGTTLEGVDPVQLRQGVDDAQAAIDACCSAVEVWQWAQTNVFGVPNPAHPPSSGAQQASSSDASPALTRAKDAEAAAAENAQETARPDDLFATTPSDSNSPASLPTPLYGLSTPFYGPVLVRLVTTLRERYHAPGIALAVLSAMRLSGPASIALGSTPELYAEALSTRWDVLGDLAGAYDVVLSARNVGVLSRSATAAAAAGTSQQQYRRPSSPPLVVGQDQEKRLRGMIERITDEARKLAVRYVPAPANGVRVGVGAYSKSSTLYEKSSAPIEPRDKAGAEELRMCEAMDRLAGRQQIKRVSQAAEASAYRRQGGQSIRRPATGPRMLFPKANKYRSSSELY